jgi:DNA replication and repair protein RecF
MWVQALNLLNFRSYSDVHIECEPGINILIGSNGQGKTNVVEAIYYLATLSSHRVAADLPLVKTGADSAVIRAQFLEDDRSVSIDLEISPGKSNRAKINRSPAARVRDVLGIIRAVMFAPEDLALVKGDPSDRRNFLDSTLIQRSPRFAGVKNDYEKILKQRNALLRSANRDNIDSTLDVWNEQLVRIGTEVIHSRIELIKDLVPHLESRYRIISGGEKAVSSSKISITYQSKFLSSTSLTPLEIADEFRIELDKRKRDELIRGVTLVGPHRDDFLMTLGELPLKGFASHGESWSAALALRISSADVLRADGVEPIIILDDVFAELDVIRRNTLIELVRDAPQVFITAAVDGDIPDSIGGKRYYVTLGSVTPS